MIFLFIGEAYFFWPPRFLRNGKLNYSMSGGIHNSDYCSYSGSKDFSNPVSGFTNDILDFKYNSQSLTGKNL